MKKESLKQQAYNIIKNKMITCEYPPNFLLNEEKLKEEIGASRTPIRDDALSRLGKAGKILYISCLKRELWWRPYRYVKSILYTKRVCW